VVGREKISGSSRHTILVGVGPSASATLAKIPCLRAARPLLVAASCLSLMPQPRDVWAGCSGRPGLQAI
jgi:hypothetical protein